MERSPCLVPPAGWRCTRGDGHEGPCAAVRELRAAPTAAQDPVYALRRIADEIEAGERGEVRAIGVVVLGDTGLDVAGLGRDGTPAWLTLMFTAAIQRFARGLG